MGVYGFGSRRDFSRVRGAVYAHERQRRRSPRVGGSTRVLPRHSSRDTTLSASAVVARFRGYFLEDLEPSQNCGQDETTARFEIWVVKQGVWITENEELVVTNRDDSLLITQGSYAHVKLFGNEYGVDYYNFADCGSAGGS